MTGFSGAGSGGKGTAACQQIQVGLDSVLVDTFGKPLMFRPDDNGEATILVKRGEN